MILTNNLKPILRFKSFKDNWTLKKLTEKCIISAGRNTPDEPDGKYYNLTMGSVSEEGKLLCSLKTNETTHILKKGDLIMPTRDVGAGFIIGRTAYIPDNSKYFAGNCLYVLTVQTDLDSLFLTNYMNSNLVREQFSKVISGGSQKQITLPNVKGINIKLPNNIEEQQKISTFFSNLDNIILLNQYKLNKLINVKKALLEKMFPANGSNVPEIRFKKYANTWKHTKLEDVCAISSGVNTPNNPSGMYYNLTMGSVSEEGKLLYSLKTNDASRLLKKGQLIMPTRDVGVGLIIGRVTYIPENDKFVAGNCLYVLDVNTVVTPLFLTYYINSNNVRKQFARVISGGSQKQITLQNVYKLDICFSELLEEQEKLGSLISNLDHIIELYRHKLEKLKNIKKACLEDMLI